MKWNFLFTLFIFLLFFSRISLQKRYVMLFARSSQGLERLEISDSETDKSARIVTLENCIKVFSESLNINVITKTGQITFQCSNENELNLWTKQLQSVAFNDKLTHSSMRNSEIEINDLYCSSMYEGKFKVSLVATDATVKNKLEPKMYTLQLTSTEIQLKSYDDESASVAKWPYRYIRKYGYKDGKFTFEAGRKCDTGEGTFKLDHENPQDIFRCMATKMKSMKKLLNGDSSGNMEENQLNAALSMEAGSRSPLPPSINSPSSPDMDMSSASFRGFISSTDTISLSFLPGPSLSSSSASTIPPQPPAKNAPISIPNKPPRKVTHTDRIITNANFHETLVQLDSPPTPPERNRSMMRSREYASIENITEAWKTMGIDEPKHTEHVATPEDELKEFAWQRSKSFNRNETRKVSIVDINENTTSVSNSNVSINNNNDDNGGYDRLDFMPLSSINKVTSSGYTTIVPIVPPLAKKKPPPITDDYEIITPSDMKPSTSSQQSEPRTPELQTSRMADDSYLGYGILRKPSLPHQLSNSSSTMVSFTSNSSTRTVEMTESDFLNDDHQIPLDYAIVSKPKRV